MLIGITFVMLAKIIFIRADNGADTACNFGFVRVNFLMLAYVVACYELAAFWAFGLRNISRMNAPLVRAQ